MHAIRPHHRDDAYAIARLLAEGWRQAYSSFMPADLLTPRIDAEQRVDEIIAWLETEFDAASEAIFVAEDDAVDGFVHVHLGDKEGLGAAGVLNLLYVDPRRQRQGLGRSLMAEAARWLVARADGPLALSAYERNPWRAFYARLGGSEVRTVTVDFDGHKLGSVLYLWKDPKLLLAAT